MDEELVKMVSPEGTEAMANTNPGNLEVLKALGWKPMEAEESNEDEESAEDESNEDEESTNEDESDQNESTPKDSDTEE